MPSLDIRNAEGDCKVPVLDALISHYSAIERRLQKREKLPAKPIVIPIEDKTKKNLVIHSNDLLLNVPKIVRFVAKQEGTTAFFIINPYRSPRIVIARHIAVYLARKILNLSFPLIGYRIGGRDHTTILFAYRKINLKVIHSFEYGSKAACYECALRNWSAK